MRRIFYWDASAGEEDDEEQLSGGEYPSDGTSVNSTDVSERPKGRWEVVKVNNCRVEDCYITSSDGRILCGEVSTESFNPSYSWSPGLARLTAPFADLTKTVSSMVHIWNIIDIILNA